MYSQNGTFKQCVLWIASKKYLIPQSVDEITLKAQTINISEVIQNVCVYANWIIWLK